jgi:hypothetical protein
MIAQALEKGCTVKFKDTDGSDLWLDGEGLWWWGNERFPTLYKLTNIFGIEDIVGTLEWEIL